MEISKSRKYAMFRSLATSPLASSIYYTIIGLIIIRVLNYWDIDSWIWTSIATMRKYLLAILWHMGVICLQIMGTAGGCIIGYVVILETINKFYIDMKKFDGWDG